MPDLTPPAMTFGDQCSEYAAKTLRQDKDLCAEIKRECDHWFGTKPARGRRMDADIKLAVSMTLGSYSDGI